MLPNIEFNEISNSEEDEAEEAVEQEEEEVEEIFEEEPIKAIPKKSGRGRGRPISDEKRKMNIENLKKARLKKEQNKKKLDQKYNKEILSVSNNSREFDDNELNEIQFLKQEIYKIKKENELNNLKKELEKVQKKPRKKREVKPKIKNVENIIEKSFNPYTNNLF